MRRRNTAGIPAETAVAEDFPAAMVDPASGKIARQFSAPQSIVLLFSAPRFVVNRRGALLSGASLLGPNVIQKVGPSVGQKAGQSAGRHAAIGAKAACG